MKSTTHYTFLSVLAVLFWGSVIAVSRDITEQIGIFRSPCYIYWTAGLLSACYLALSPRARRELTHFSSRYLLACGACFVAYTLFLYLALGWIRHRELTFVISICNYLWPVLTVVLSFVILRHRCTSWLFLSLGMIGYCVGVVTVMVTLADVSSSGPAMYFSWMDILACLAALAAAVCWALYNNFARLWAGNTSGSAVPLFLIATALMLSPLLLLESKEFVWTGRLVAEILFAGMCPTFLAYIFWDMAMRNGTYLTVATLSYFTPMVSGIAIGILCRIYWDIELLTGFACVTIAAVLCRKAVRETPDKVAP